MHPSENSDGMTLEGENGHLDGSFNDQHLFKNSMISPAPRDSSATAAMEELKNSASCVLG